MRREERRHPGRVPARRTPPPAPAGQGARLRRASAPDEGAQEPALRHPRQEAWKDGVQTYLGIVTAGFPNLFFLLGLNTGLGHDSVVFTA
jgi:hypothetical protein